MFPSNPFGTAETFQGTQEVPVLLKVPCNMFQAFLTYSRKIYFFRRNLTVLFRVKIIMHQEWSTYCLTAMLAVLMNGEFFTNSQSSGSLTDDVHRRFISQCFTRSSRRRIWRDLLPGIGLWLCGLARPSNICKSGTLLQELTLLSTGRISSPLKKPQLCCQGLFNLQSGLPRLSRIIPYLKSIDYGLESHPQIPSEPYLD